MQVNFTSSKGEADQLKMEFLQFLGQVSLLSKI